MFELKLGLLLDWVFYIKKKLDKLGFFFYLKVFYMISIIISYYVFIILSFIWGWIVLLFWVLLI